jgi:hypothetical protein
LFSIITNVKGKVYRILLLGLVPHFECGRQTFEIAVFFTSFQQEEEEKKG